jgi:hypothetical protein
MSACLDRWHDKRDYGTFSIGITMMFGLVKEYADYQVSKRWTRDNWMDLGCDFLGAITGKLLSYTF